MNHRVVVGHACIIYLSELWNILQHSYVTKCMYLCVCVCVCVCVCAQSCPTLCGPMDCSVPGSAILGIFQARILEWVVIPYARDFLNPGIEAASLVSPALEDGFFATNTTWETQCNQKKKNSKLLVQLSTFPL